jgi:hypothetical protein
MSLFKRGGAKLAKFLSNSGNPANVSGKPQLFAKTNTFDSIVHLFGMDGNGNILPVTGGLNYWFGTLSGDVAGVSDNALVDLDTKGYGRGTFTLDGAGGITPEAGTYLCIAWLDFLGSAAGASATYQWYNDVGGTPVAKGYPASGAPVTNVNHVSMPDPAIAIFSVTGSQKIGLYTLQVSGAFTITLFAQYTKALILQIGAGS